MNSALLAGLSGTLANQTYMDVLGNNIANSSTVGFKESRITFQDALYDTIRGGRSGASAGIGGTNSAQVGSGTSTGQIQTLHTQGALNYTGASLDAAIEGDGMFLLSDGAGGSFYTRDGSFTLDSSRTLVTGSSGMLVLGWTAQNGQVQTTGEPAALSFPIGEVRPGQTTSSVTMSGNLDSGASVGDVQTATVSVYDSLGRAHEVTLTFENKGSNAWNCTITGTGVTTATGNLTFNPADGSLTGGSPVSVSIAPSGASPMTVSVDLASLTQLNQEGSTIIAQHQNGTPSSTLSGVSIGEGGEIQGNFDDGHVEVLGQIAVAGFANPGGLERSGDNLYQQGANSGQVSIGTAGTGGRGEIRSRRLENSNVDLTSSFVEIMTAQRGFQASTRVISAANSMLEEVMQLNR